MFSEHEPTDAVERAFFDGPPHVEEADDDEPAATRTPPAPPSDDSRYATLRRGPALAVLALLVVAMGWFYAATGTGGQRVAAHKVTLAVQDQDYDLYRAIAARVHDGQNYYAAAGTELRTRGYPTRPVFNWRQPTQAFVLAHLPFPALLLTLFGVCALVLTLRWLRGAWGQWPALAVCVLHIGALPHSTEATYFHEVWAGSLLILSATLYATGRWRWGMLALLAALSFREFALLPCGVAVLFALYDRRWAELKLWALALPLYGALLTLHFVAVAHQLGPADLVIPSRSWLAFGGARFLIAATRADMLWYYLPPFVNALALPLALFGYGDWRNEGATRMGLTLFGFMLAFSIIGLPCNDYWGFIFLPLMSVGLARSPRALRELLRAIRTPSPRQDHDGANDAAALQRARTTALMSALAAE